MEASCQDFKGSLLADVKSKILDFVFFGVAAEFGYTLKDLKDEVEELLRVDVVFECELLIVLKDLLVDVIRCFVVCGFSKLDTLDEFFLGLVV